MLGYFPALVHRLFPKTSLTLGQSVATKLDQTWYENVGPKGLALIQVAVAKTVNFLLHDKVLIYLTFFLVAIPFELLTCSF